MEISGELSNDFLLAHHEYRTLELSPPPPPPPIFIRLRCKNKLLPGFFTVGHSKTLYNLYIHIDAIKRGCKSGDLIQETHDDYYLINCLCTWIPRRTSSL